jgi:hypothetical protein
VVDSDAKRDQLGSSFFASHDGQVVLQCLRLHKIIINPQSLLIGNPSSKVQRVLQAIEVTSGLSTQLRSERLSNDKHLLKHFRVNTTGFVSIEISHKLESKQVRFVQNYWL